MPTHDDLRATLAAAWQDHHWCFSEDFLKQLTISQPDFEKVIQKWWGNREVWLDLLATNVGKAIGSRVSLDVDLGADWSEKANDWIDATMVCATEGMSSPPCLAMLWTKAMLLVSKVMGDAEANITKVTGNQPKCEECGKSYPKWREQCPHCEKARQAAEEQRLAGAKAAEWRDLKPAPLEDVAWKEALKMKWCHGGSGGVFLVKLPAGGICVQGSDWVPGEIFAQRLGAALDVRCAAMRIVTSAVEKPVTTCEYTWDDVQQQPLGQFLERRQRRLGMEQHEWNRGLYLADAQGKELLHHHNLGELSEKQFPVMVQHPAGEAVQSEGALIRRALQIAKADESDKSHTKMLKKGFSLTVLEYVDGLVMMGMPAHEHLKKVPSNDPMWHELGKLMAFDMLLNNFDRLPLAWSNDGNLGNVMLGASQGAVVGIDQCIALIKHPVGLQTYLGRVKQVVAEASLSREGVLASASAAQVPAKSCFQGVKDAIQVNTAIELGPEELASMRAGVASFMSEMAAMSASGDLDKKLLAVSKDLTDIAASLPPRLDEGGLNWGPPPVDEFCDLVRKVVAAGQEALTGAGA